MFPPVSHLYFYFFASLLLFFYAASGLTFDLLAGWGLLLELVVDGGIRETAVNQDIRPVDVPSLAEELDEIPDFRRRTKTLHRHDEIKG